MVRGSYVKGTSFVGVSLFRSEDGVRKDIKQKLTSPYRGTLSILISQQLFFTLVDNALITGNPPPVSIWQVHWPRTRRKRTPLEEFVPGASRQVLDFGFWFVMLPHS